MLPKLILVGVSHKSESKAGQLVELALGSCSAEVLGECLRKDLTGWLWTLAGVLRASKKLLKGSQEQTLHCVFSVPGALILSG